jgi:hypothetical protein
MGPLPTHFISAVATRTGAITYTSSIPGVARCRSPRAGVGEANGLGERQSFAGAVLFAEKRRRCQRTEQA